MFTSGENGSRTSGTSCASCGRCGPRSSARRLTRLADLLGDHHDHTVLHEDLRAREELSDKKTLATAIERRQDELLEGALDLGARLYAEKPKALLRRLSVYWESWRES